MKRAVVGFSLNRHLADVRELDGVADEINQDLGQAAAVTMTRWQFGGNFHLERELLVRGQRLQRAADGVGNVLNRVIGQFQDELTGLDLGQIEHVIDESEQVFAVGLKSFEYSKHLLGRLTISAVRHQFGVAEDGVERRAQLMAHIGKELRLVLARFFKLAALVLDFIEQANVLDGYARLVGEGGGQVDLLVGEGANGLTHQDDSANRMVFAQRRYAEDRAKPDLLLHFPISIFPISQDIGDLDRFAFEYCSPDNAAPSCFERNAQTCFSMSGRAAVSRDGLIVRALLAMYRRHVGLAQPRR